MVNISKLVNHNTTGPSQEDARSDAAQGRDRANGQTPVTQFIARVQAQAGL